MQSSEFRKSEAEDMKIGKKGTKIVIHRQYACICRKNFFLKKKSTDTLLELSKAGEKISYISVYVPATTENETYKKKPLAIM